MIRGRCEASAGIRRPFVDATFVFPTLNNGRLEVPLLVDTGADGTRLGPYDAARLETSFGVSIFSLPRGDTHIGIGGEAVTHVIPAILLLGGFATTLALHTLEQPPSAAAGIPSVLGRDILSHFALFMEERTGRVLLLEPQEADALGLPS